MEVGQNHANSILNISQSLKHDLGSDESCFQAKLDEIDHAINLPSSSRPIEEKIPLSAINMGINLGDASLNTKIFGPATTSRVLELMQKTLADPNNANHESY